MRSSSATYDSNKDAVYLFIYWAWLFPMAIILIICLIYIMKNIIVPSILLETLLLLLVYAIFTTLIWNGFNYYFDGFHTLSVRIFKIKILQIDLNLIIEASHKTAKSYTWGLSCANISLKSRSGWEYNLSPRRLPEFLIELHRINPHIIISNNLTKKMEVLD
jgi:hypothetical protein